MSPSSSKLSEPVAQVSHCRQMIFVSHFSEYLHYGLFIGRRGRDMMELLKSRDLDE